MKKVSKFELARQWTVVISFSFVGCSFWGMTVAAIVKYVFGVTNQDWLLLIAIVSGLLLGCLFLPQIWKQARGKY